MIGLREVDSAIKNYLKELYGNDVPVKIFEANIKSNIETYPIVTFFNYDIKPNKKKTNFNSMTTKKLTENTLEVENAPYCYDFYYQIDFWSKTMKDMGTLLSTFLFSDPSGVYLVEVSDSETTQQAQLDVITHVVRDFYENGENIYRRSYTCKMSVYLPTKPTIKQTPSGVNLNKIKED